jgi:hypothetical protein
VLAANVRERGKTADAWHIQIQQQEIGFRIGFHDSLQRIEAVCLDDIGILDAIADCMDQRFPEKRMVIRNDECALVRHMA